MSDFKLYPPVIGSRIPAFYQDSDDNLVITVPFVNNRSVSYENISDIVLRIKTIQTDWVSLVAYYEGDLKEAWNSGLVKYIIPKKKYQKEMESWRVNVGQFYKIQLAYKDKDGDLGYYSSVGISKFSFYPEVSIEGLNKTEPSTHRYNYIGSYSQKYNDRIMDTTEKVYKYKFIIESEGSIIKDTGWLLHNSDLDENEYSSIDIFEYLNELPAASTIQYLVQTSSGIEAQSAKYPIVPSELGQNSITCKTELDFDNGYINITAIGNSNKELYVVRNIKNSNDKYKIGKITINSSFKDCTIEQGIEYEYSIYELQNDGTYTCSEKSSIISDYEDIFLFDGEKQLKIRFNPNVNSLSETIMESKVDTIGGKYPVFLRNGDTRYFVFSFGGLITYNMDEQGLFDEGFAKLDYWRESTDTKQEININSTTSQNAYNYKREREFREKVLNWLNNGQPKLYRSATEGIKIVRLTGNNLTPNQQVSRMIWSFNSNAIEVDNHDYEALVKNKIYKNV